MSRDQKEAAAAERRRRPTKAEDALWQRIADRRLDGFRFEREKEIFGWYADFYCAAARLVVEVDGKEHRERRAEDNARDEYMRANYYRVLRLPAGLVFNDLDEAVHRVRRAVDTDWAKRRRDKFQKAALARRQPRETEPGAGEEADEPPREMKRRSPNKAFRRFVCGGCGREFSVDIYSATWIECRRCLTSGGLRPICHACKKPVDKVTSEAWNCRRCADIRDVARRAAGSGETPTGALHDRRGRAQRPRP